MAVIRLHNDLKKSRRRRTTSTVMMIDHSKMPMPRVDSQPVN
jgi:hypothetical protein